MMLAKFSGSGSSTATSSVSSADSSSGASTRHDIQHAAQRQQQDHGDRHHRDDRRVAECAHDGLAGRHDGDRGAAGVGRDRGHLRRRTAAGPALLRACGVGITCTRARPSGSSQSRAISGGIEASVTGSAFSDGAQVVELLRQEPCQRRVGRQQHVVRRRSRAGAGRRRSPTSGWSFGSFARAGSICASAVLAASLISSGVIGAAASCGSSVGARIELASAMIASFSC